MDNVTWVFSIHCIWKIETNKTTCIVHHTCLHQLKAASENSSERTFQFWNILKRWRNNSCVRCSSSTSAFLGTWNLMYYSWWKKSCTTWSCMTFPQKSARYFSYQLYSAFFFSISGIYLDLACFIPSLTKTNWCPKGYCRLRGETSQCVYRVLALYLKRNTHFQNKIIYNINIYIYIYITYINIMDVHEHGYI